MSKPTKKSSKAFRDLSDNALFNAGLGAGNTPPPKEAYTVNEHAVARGAYHLARHMLGPVAPVTDCNDLAALICSLHLQLKIIAGAAASIDQNGLHSAEI